MRIQYPANWFSETRNLEYPQMVRFFPMEFMAERYPPVVLGIIFLNASNSPISLNLTQVADMFETPFTGKSWCKNHQLYCEHNSL